MDYEIRTYYLDKPLKVGRVFDVFMPSEIKKDVALFIVHGGGWRAGSRQLHHSIIEEFVNRGYVVATTDYRLYAKDAFEQLAIMQMPKRIWILKKLGYHIETKTETGKNRFGKPVHYTRYTLVEE